MINSHLCLSLSFDWEEWHLAWPPPILCPIKRKRELYHARTISLFPREFQGFSTQRRDVASNLATLWRLSGAREEWGRKPTEGADIKKVGNLTLESCGLTVMHGTWGVGHRGMTA